MTGRKHISTQQTVPIDSTGEVFETNLEQSKLLSINIVGESSATYALDVSPDGDTYFESEETYTGTDIRDVFELTDRYIRVRVTSTGNTNDTADITIQGLQ